MCANIMVISIKIDNFAEKYHTILTKNIQKQ